MTMAHSSTSFVPATTQTRQTSSPLVARTLFRSCLSCVPPTLLCTHIYIHPRRVRVIDRHVCRPSRLLSSRFPYHRPSLVPTHRFSLFIRSMVLRVKPSVRSMSNRVLTSTFAGSPLRPRTLVYTYSQKHPMLTRISFLSVAG
jgi:hypothetical protein